MVTETELSAPLHPVARSLGILGILGILVSFASTVLTFLSIESAPPGSASGVARLVGADVELGYPSSAVALLIFIVVLSVSAATRAGAALQRSWSSALVCLLIIGVVFEIWVAYLAFSWFAVIQLLIFAAMLVILLRSLTTRRPPTLGVFLVVASVIGFFAAFRLTVDKVGTFTNPTVAPSCNFSVIVQCGVNLRSWQGSLFGFPNPLIGVGGWMAVLVIGVMIVGGITFARWFWVGLNIGVLFAFCFIGWLIYTSIFSLGTLCPWCMVTWSVVIPTFWIVTLHNLKTGVFTSFAPARQFFAGAYTYVPLITLVNYLVVAGVAQAQMNLLQYI